MEHFRKSLKGLFWMGGLRVIIRGFGFARVAVLARVLSPKDFGVFGVASLVLAFLEIFTETGVNVFLVQRKNNFQEYLDTAWIVSIIRGILISVTLFLVAPPIANFFSSQESANIIRLIALAPLIRGFINPSIVSFLKDLQFSKEFRLRSSVYIFDGITAIIFSLLLKNPFGIVIGIIAGVLLELQLSYVFVKPHPRFRFDLSYAKEIVSKGKWVTLSGIFNYLAQNGDDIVVARILGSTPLGLYQVAYKVSTLPLTEVSEAVGKVTFPTYTKDNNNKRVLKSNFIYTSLIVFFLVVIFGVFIYLFPGPIIKIILGEKWLDAAEVLKVLAVFGVVRAGIGLCHSLFLAVGRQDVVAKICFIQFVVLAMLIFPLTVSFGILGAGYSAIVSSLVPLPMVFYFLKKVLKDDVKGT